MKTLLRATALCCTALVMVGAAAKAPTERRAIGRFTMTSAPLFPGSTFAPRVDGISPPYDAFGLGNVDEDGGVFHIPLAAPPGTAALVAGNAFGTAMRQIRIAPAPDPTRPFIAVAAYDDGIEMHDIDSFAALGLLATAGAPSDGAIPGAGHLAATDTDGNSLVLATLAPWSVSMLEGAPAGDELAFDSLNHDLLVTDRDVAGSGALTEIGTGGSARRIATGETAEGLAIDARRNLAYVANVNDGTVAVVDLTTMRVIRRIRAIARDFSLALSSDGSRLYVVSNQSLSSPFGSAGATIEIALNRPHPRIIARSGPLAFPVGVALDERSETLLVTAEGAAAVYVLNARTGRAERAPLRTCSVPWQPTFDPIDDRLYVPCASSNAVDVFDARTLRRLHGAPFATAGYPLAIAIWHPRRDARRSPST